MSAKAVAATQAGQPLFDGKTLAGWKVTEFGGHGEVKVEDQQIILSLGVALTGVTYTNTNSLPKTSYELTLEAKKLEGNDFFCGVTFPFKDSHCSLILGGWGGGIVGISSINDSDASDNETTKFLYFEKNKWFKIRIKVLPNKIQAWIDEDQLVDLDTTDKKISLRPGDIELNVPLGFSTYQTGAALKNIRFRSLGL